MYVYLIHFDLDKMIAKLNALDFKSYKDPKFNVPYFKSSWFRL